MSLIINHNLSALNTHRNLSSSGSSMSKSIEKLSSGYKINVGADDPSGLIISEQLRSQISGLERAVRNSSEAFNLIGIAEGALNEMNTILKKMRALAIHAANSGVTSPEQVAADQSEMDSGIETLNRIANTTRYSDQYLLNGSKQLVYDVTTVVNEPTDHALLDTKMTRIDQVFKRDGVKMSIGFAGEKSQYQANTKTSAQRAYLEADAAHSLCEISGSTVTGKQEFILTGTSGSRMFSFAQGTHVGTIVEAINNVKDSTGIGASLTFASDVRIDRTATGTPNGSSPDYKNGTPAEAITGYDDGTYVYQSGDVQIYNAGLNNVSTAKISDFCLTPDAAASFKVGFNCDGDGKIYAKVVDKSTNAIEYYKDKDCTMLIGKGDDTFFAATNNSGIPSSPTQNLDGIFMKLNPDYAQALDVYEIAVVGQRLDNQKDMHVEGLQGWTDVDNSVMSGVNLGVNTSPEGELYYEYKPIQFETDGKTVKTFQINVYKHASREPKYLVASSGIVENNIKIEEKNAAGNVTQLSGQTVRLESVLMDDGTDSGLNITLNLPKKGVLDGVTGKTVDEIKASDEYKALMEDLSTAKGDYAEIADEYTSAKAAREKAIGDLDTAQKALERLQSQEDKVRREIDRLEARDIQQQQIDAQKDLEIAQNNLISAAREAVLDETLEESYMDVTKASPGAPEKIAEQLGNEILKVIDNAIGNGTDPSDIDWADATVKQNLLSNVWMREPLSTITSGMTQEEIDAVTADANALLDAAYAAATDPALVKDIGDKANTLDTLSNLEANYNTALAALNVGQASKLDPAIAAGVGQVDWTGYTATTDATALATEIETQLLQKIQDAVNNDTFKLDFKLYDWTKEKSAIVDSVVSGATIPANMTADDIKGIVSDMYDIMTDRNTGLLADYGNKYRVQQDTPHPDIDDFSAKIGTDAATATAAATAASSAFVGTVQYDDFQLFFADNGPGGANAPGYTWDDFAAEVAKAAGKVLANNAYATTPINTDATFITALTAELTDVSFAADYPALTAALASTPVAGGGNADHLDDYVAAIAAGTFGTNSAADNFNKENIAADAARTAATNALAAFQAGEEAAAIANADASVAAVNAYANELDSVISDALAQQLLELANDGVELNAANLATAKNAVVSAIMDAVAAASATPGALQTFYNSVSEGALTAFVGDIYDKTIAEADGQDYIGLVEDFAELQAVYPGGGAIPRAEDRLERYADRIESAPLKAQTSATTRKPWERLVDTYAGTTQAELTQLATDVGTYLRNLAETAAAAGNEDSIVWNDGTVNNDVWDHIWDLATSATGPTNTLWTSIQNDPDPVQGAAREEDFKKIVEKMFSAATKPDYNEDVSALSRAATSSATDDIVYRSPVKKYFDQYDKLQELEAQLEQKEIEKEGLDDQIEDLMDLVSYPNGDLVLDLHDASEEFAIISREADPLLEEIARLEGEAKTMLAGAGGGKAFMPSGEQVGSVSFTNLGMRIYAVDYGSAETIRIQNKAGNLFYQYREADTLEKLMVEPDTTVQVAGQDAQISLNGAPVFTTGLVANTTTPDFSGSLVFNAGTLGQTTLAVAGHDTGKLFSKATALQGIEENEAQIAELRRHFEPPAMVVPMGDNDTVEVGMLNKNGKPVNLYMDFSQLDPTVEVKVDNYGAACPIEVSFTEPNILTINANSLGLDPENEMTITVKVDPQNLKNGYYVTDPALKGLYIKTDDLVDLNRSGGEYAPPEMPSTTPEAGDVMLEVNSYATNPRSNTSESMENFLGGMQFQLGNTEGDQDRTVYSIQSMAMSELGRISYNGTEYCLQNVLGGGLASLSKDPILAMRIIAQAVDDVSTLRARLGAFQANMLQTNINSLEVAIENITKTESAIRDTDMAAESTQFTRFQIMQQAGTSMLAQANQVSQNVLSLLQ